MTEMSNFEELLAKMCGRKDVAAREKLYKIYAARVQSACRRYSKDNEEAQDFTQDAFMRIFDKIGKFRYSGEGSLGRWLVRVAVNMIIDRKRRDKSLGIKSEIDEAAEDIPQPTEEEAASVPLDVLHKMIDSLSNAKKMVFNLRCVDEYSYKEIAKMIGISENAASSTFAKARIELGMMIKEYVKING